MAALAKPVARAATVEAGATQPASCRRRRRRQRAESAEGAQVQPKLRVGEPDDAYEREADFVADRVMKMPPRRLGDESRGSEDDDEGRTIRRDQDVSMAQHAPAGSEQQSAQREAMEDEEPAAQREAMEDEEPEAQREAMDEDEPEAQREAMEEEEPAAQREAMEEEEPAAQREAMEEEEPAAQREAMEDEEPAAQREAMEDEEPAAQREAMEDEEPEAQREAMGDEEPEAQRDAMDEDEPAAQREAMEEEEPAAQREATDDEEPSMQRRPSRSRQRVPRVTTRFERTLRRIRQAGGQALPGPLLRFMQSRFGQSFDDVRVHAGPEAASLAQGIRARAFTLGKDIVFGPGQYRPHGPQGRRLIAHELTHVLQQRGGLHSVRREVLPEGDRPKRPTLRQIRNLFGLRPGQVPRAVLEIVIELLERTLAKGQPAESLAAFTDDTSEDAITTRTLESSDYRLELHSEQTEGGRELRWVLKRAMTDEPVFGRAQRRAEATDAPPNRTRDEEAISVPTPGGTRAEEQAEHRYVEARPEQPSEVESPTELERRRQSNAGSSEAPRSAPEPTPPRSDSLDAVDQAEPPKEEPPSEAGRGGAAGSDDPGLARRPVDEEATEEVPEEEDAAADPTIRRSLDRSAPPRSGTRSRVAADVAHVAASPGRGLSARVRNFMESRFGADFSRVRVHDDAVAGRAARGLGARAFTRGEHIAFAPGGFRPHALEGLRLLAHELSHVLQQRSGRHDAIQRDSDCPPPEPVPEVEVVSSPGSPGEDPAFNDAKNRVDNRAENQSQHGEGEDKSSQANAAADVKEGEKKSHAQKDQVGKMDAEAANPPGFDRESFINKVLDEVEQIAPPTLDDVFKFSSRHKAGEVKSAVTGEVTKAQDKSKGPLQDAAKEDPGPGASPRSATPFTVEPPGPAPGSVRADRGMPPPKTASEFDVRPDTVRTENILKEACITREFMDKHDDDVLGRGAEAQDELSEASKSAPEKFREEEATELEGARSGASTKGQEGLAGMVGERGEKFAEVGDKQQKTKADNEAKRDAAAAEIDGIFAKTQSKVTTRLDTLETDVNTKFDTGAGKATSKFETFVRTNAEKHKKAWYETAAEWISEALFDAPPPEVQDFYAEGRATFIADMRVVIGDIADVVDEGLKDARQIVTDGKAEVEKKLDSLGSDLEDFKQMKSEEMNDKFRGLEAEIDKKQGDLVKGLAKRYVKALENVKAIEDRVREEFKNVLEKAADVYHEVKDAVLGWIEKLSAIVGDTAKQIIKEPGKFLTNLGAGIVQGLSMFVDNIGENLKGAVVQWLTGNLGAAGIALPTSFDAKGIIGFLLELVGLGVANIKNIARKVFGPTIVRAIEMGEAGFEKAKEIFDILASQGPSGLFQYLAGEFERMKEQVMGEAGKAIAESLVIAGIKKVIGIISGLVSGGVGTVVTIVATIIDVVLWFRDNAAQLAELVQTVAGMAKAVLAGQVGALANAVNNLLKRLLPIVLSFVGALVGIGGVVRKIQNIFKAIRKPATKAITALFKKIKNALKKLIAKIKKKFGKGKKGKKKGKDKKLKPKVVKKKIIAALKKPAKAEDPAAAIAETHAQANSLKSKYQPKLEKGTIKIQVLDTSPADVEKDDDIDISVSLSPDTKVAKEFKQSLVTKFSSQRSKSHKAARPGIKSALQTLDNDGKKKATIKNWAQAKAAISGIDPVAGMLAEPVDAGHPFGADMGTAVDQGVRGADANATPAQVSDVKQKINRKQGAYAFIGGELTNALFKASISKGRIVHLVRKAYKSAKSGEPPGKMPTKVVFFNANRQKSTMWLNEYKRQLKGQESGINAMTTGGWLKNRDSFLARAGATGSGRHEDSAAAQKKFRKEFRAKMLAEEIENELAKLEKKGVVGDPAFDRAHKKASATVDKFMAANAALHDPDQIAGGSPTEVEQMGLASVNSSIGSQWRSRASQLDQAVRAWVKGNPSGEESQMNVKLARG